MIKPHRCGVLKIQRARLPTPMPVRGLEPLSLSAHGPKPCVSANFTTPA